MDTNSRIIDEILTTKEICQYLRISKGTIRKLGIPCLKIRRRVLYRKSDLEKFILKNLMEVE